MNKAYVFDLVDDYFCLLKLDSWFFIDKVQNLQETLKKLRNEISDLEQKSGEILNINREMQAAFQDKLLMSKRITPIKPCLG